MDLAGLLRNKRTIRVIGFDDAPFVRRSPDPVPVAGVVCAGTRFEGMVWGQIQPDGWDATEELCRLLLGRKFLPQLHLVLLDGISLGGFNVVDLPLLAERLGKPCVAVMRRQPDLMAVKQALQRLPEADRRLKIMQRAGCIHARSPFYFQVCGASPDLIAEALPRLSDRGHVPEALRIAHLITAAVVKGESGRQA
ncbi:MAG TPA: DUF99 family protein [Allocoleopsis sp.]